MVVFFDIDGTIVDDDTQIIPDSAVEAVRALRKNGHFAVVNTGRPYGHIDPRVRAMDFGGWICGCGMEIYLNGRWITRACPDEELCRYVVNSVEECGMQVMYEAEDALCVDGALSTDPRIQTEVERFGDKHLTVADIRRVPGMKFMKFVTFDAPGCRRAEFIRQMEPWFTCIDRGNTMVEYVKKGCSKAKGVETLLKHLGISLSQTLAVVDSTYDLPMFEAAGHTVCMGEGMEALKARSEYVTDGVLEDGIAKALKHYGLI